MSDTLLTARAILKPLRERVERLRRLMLMAGKKPTIVLLGEKQFEEIQQYLDVRGGIGAAYLLRLRIIWVNEPDCVALYEERKGGWF